MNELNFKIQLVYPVAKVIALKGEKGDSGDAGDYATLANKPRINNIELTGNKTGSDLGLVPKTVTDALDSRVATLETNSVPKTRKVNNKALSSDITVEAQDVPYSNATSGLSASNMQGAVDELQTILSKMRTGNVTNITANSTATVKDLGITDGNAFYFIALQTNTTSANTGSAYTLRQTSSNFYVSPLAEGTHNSAPRIASNGALKLNTNTSNHGIFWLCIKMVGG